MKPVKRELVHELAAKELQNYIHEQRFKEGDKLPSLEELCNMLQVGRSSMREALRYLEAMEVIEMINGKGIYVKDVDTYRFSAKVKGENFKQILLHVLEVRRGLEGQCVELAASRATPEDIAQMEYFLKEMKRLDEIQGDKSQFDMHFHRTIFKASGNPVMESVINSVWDMMEHFWKYPFGKKDIFDDTLEYHFTIAEAIKNKDAVKARQEFNLMMDLIETDIHKASQNS
ncbi:MULTISPECIES: FadR/GntR family transcriptional regulator [unclassified Paenibacillus]|uniref:FadR/GntR family transcriptional regulator n=1 Tax=unclassified Paenibacillus TaxID=185978 RepID=UPI001C0F920F|nr:MULTISPECIES: FadR/GntR family transcriptional regulator [unclassified Paenibacillus]MBU5443806.1 FadR family transcriptional regulator [Paenibacillus sp. MSJ-34]CAH0120695.1 HTH-type transcriptional regulator LutR [Paenibacillus sp. CECT 9249]